jgi:GxxExxY protein
LGLKFDLLSSEVIAAAIEVHKKLGPGFVETVYEQALKMELAKREISFEYQKRIEVRYDGAVVGTHVLDLLVGNELVVELKAIRALEDVHFAQVRSYLRATDAKVGLLLNFGTPVLTIKRIAN